MLELLKKVLAEDGIRICGVYERSDAKVRKQEGMEPYKGFIGEEFPTLVEIVENGVKYQVDVKDGSEDRIFPGSEIQSSGNPEALQGMPEFWTVSHIQVLLL